MLLENYNYEDMNKIEDAKNLFLILKTHYITKQNNRTLSDEIVKFFNFYKLNHGDQ